MWHFAAPGCAAYRRTLQHGQEPRHAGDGRRTGHADRGLSAAAAFGGNGVHHQLRSRSMVGAVRFVRRLVASEPIASEIAAETRPGLGVDSDDAILDAYRAMGTTAYHAVGTCRMGSDPDSVVDPLTGVRGTTGLHVADLSIAPFVPAGNTFAPVMALAWRAAELIAALDASAENGP